MTPLLVRYDHDPNSGTCSLCEKKITGHRGAQLISAETLQLVCQSCGKKNDPVMAALVHLAEEAERIGRIGRHTIVAPYAALLELAQAADNFASIVPSTREAS